MRIFLILLLCLSFPIIGHCFGGKLPKGYRFPEKSDYTEDEQSYLENNFPYKIEADFDGNGKVDAALLLIKGDNSGWTLFAFMRSKNDQIDTFPLDHTEHNVPYLYMGISILEPGKLKTACGKGYGDCKPGEASTLYLKNPGINYFVFESANSVFYWNEKMNKFSRIWLSD